MLLLTTCRYVPCFLIALLAAGFAMGTLLVPVKWAPCDECEHVKKKHDSHHKAPDCNRLACDPAWNASTATAECEGWTAADTPQFPEGRVLEGEDGHGHHDHDHRRLLRKSSKKNDKNGGGDDEGRAQDPDAPECEHTYPDNFCAGDFA